MPTDKKILMRGLRYLFAALPLFFIGPVVVNNAFQNKKHPFFMPILGLGCILCLIGMWFMFLGLRTVMSSMKD
ncbi:DUF6095 family protein [Flavobacterium sp. RHBU_3]|uniref:DUF6095 family protein n=1 Tax=Flavobacterium sp. RHBU_3 TaxID=3391184 RepID=UPI003984FCF0